MMTSTEQISTLRMQRSVQSVAKLSITRMRNLSKKLFHRNHINDLAKWALIPPRDRTGHESATI